MEAICLLEPLPLITGEHTGEGPVRYPRPELPLPEGGPPFVDRGRDEQEPVAQGLIGGGPLLG
eukprot:11186917-Lingulodinium_polyedra.AAC.1